MLSSSVCVFALYVNDSCVLIIQIRLLSDVKLSWCTPIMSQSFQCVGFGNVVIIYKFLYNDSVVRQYAQANAQCYTIINEITIVDPIIVITLVDWNLEVHRFSFTKFIHVSVFMQYPEQKVNPQFDIILVF